MRVTLQVQWRNPIWSGHPPRRACPRRRVPQPAIKFPRPGLLRLRGLASKLVDSQLEPNNNGFDMNPWQQQLVPSLRQLALRPASLQSNASSTVHLCFIRLGAPRV